MKKIVFTLLTIVCGTALSFAQEQVINDPNAQVRNVSGFHAIKVGGAIDLYLSQSDKETVVVSASSEELRDKIQTVVEDGKLKIYVDEHWRWWKSMKNKKLKAYVSVKSLDKLEAAGASDVYLSGMLRSEDLIINLSGASDL